jgi:predicted nucleic acid-binding protein
VILVDTSVWVEHLRRGNARLAGLLDQGQVACHPFVIGELMLGTFKNRTEVLDLLAELPAAQVVRHEDALTLVTQRALFGKGLGWVDVHLVSSALVERVPFWTLDRRLAAVARALNAGWEGYGAPA